MTSSDRLIFDANALVDAALAGEIATVYDQHTLELAFFEATNVAWKIATHRDAGRDHGMDLVEVINGAHEEMNVLRVGELSLADVYTTAFDRGLTAYDGAYVAAARQLHATLVSADTGIQQNAPDDVTVIGLDELID